MSIYREEHPTYQTLELIKQVPCLHIQNENLNRPAISYDEGYGSIEKPSEEAISMLNKVKSDIELRAGKDYESLKAVEMRTRKKKTSTWYMLKVHGITKTEKIRETFFVDLVKFHRDGKVVVANYRFNVEPEMGLNYRNLYFFLYSRNPSVSRFVLNTKPEKPDKMAISLVKNLKGEIEKIGKRKYKKLVPVRMIKNTMKKLITYLVELKGYSSKKKIERIFVEIAKNANKKARVMLWQFNVPPKVVLGYDALLGKKNKKGKKI